MNSVGRMIRCDRCGTEEFEEYAGTDTRDGGFTRIDRYSPAEGWGHEWIENRLVDMCPVCFEEYEKIEARHKKEWERFIERK